MINFSQKFKKPIFGRLWAQIPKFVPNGIFHEKLASVTFLRLLTPNFVQKIRKN